MSRLFDLSGKVAVVSGAAQGFGRAISLALAEHGADLLLVDRGEDGMATTADAVRGFGRRAVCARCDVGVESDIHTLFSTLDREYSRIDFLANVAGDPVISDVESLTQRQLLASFQTLVFGRLLVCQEAGRRMLAQGRGSIVNIASIAAVTALGRGHIAYSMAMGAVAQMTRELSTEWAGRGVRVNAIMPAQVVNSGLAARMAADPQLETQWLRGIPAGRLGQATDIQGLAVFLAADASSWITGALLPMDGGNLAANPGATFGRTA
jgi:NAD(P)-dependent dehydrogenase (short-subunit alcohol dehydrogenase family)